MGAWHVQHDALAIQSKAELMCRQQAAAQPVVWWHGDMLVWWHGGMMACMYYYRCYPGPYPCCLSKSLLKTLDIIQERTQSPLSLSLTTSSHAKILQTFCNYSANTGCEVLEAAAAQVTTFVSVTAFQAMNAGVQHRASSSHSNNEPAQLHGVIMSFLRLFWLWMLPHPTASTMTSTAMLFHLKPPE